MLNRERLCEELYRQHNKRVDVNDPIFMNITLNDLVLSHYLEKFQAHLEAQSAQVDELMVKRINESLELHNRQLNENLETLSGLGSSVAGQVTQAGNQCVQGIREASDAATKNIEKALRVLEPYWCFALVAVGVLFGVLAQKFILHV
jgi:hypothetical protein